MKRCFVLILFSLFFTRLAFAEAFIIEDIRIVGLQRLTAGSVFNYIPYRAGDEIADENHAQLIRTLYDTSFFEDVSLLRDGNVLVIEVVERPVVGQLDIEGNREIDTDMLKDALRSSGLSLGNPYNPALVSEIETELYKLYYSRGKYEIIISLNVEGIGPGRVGVNVNIQEGVTARIKSINIVGNKAFSEERLLGVMKQSETKFYTILTQTDRYSGYKLQGDLETLEAYYANRGFLDFKVLSSQVMLSPEKDAVYITVNVSEGLPYKLTGVKINGSDEVSETEKADALTLKVGEWYSRKTAYETRDAVKRVYESKGFAFSKVLILPKVDKNAHTVELTYSVDEGKRVYVRRIEIDGNFYTHDEVVRRELRQMEAAVFDGDKIEQSTKRIRRLSTITKVSLKKVPVEGSPDQVDLVYDVEESSTRFIEGGVGYSPATGSLSVNAAYKSENFLGTGNEFRLSVSMAKESKRFDMTFSNPYFTIDGISAGVKFFYNKNDLKAADLSDWIMNQYGAMILLGFPVNEDEKIGVSFGYRNVEIRTGKNTPSEIIDSLNQFKGRDTKEGKKFDELLFAMNWSHDTLNKPFFATEGSITKASAEATLPGSDVTYYKLDVQHKTYTTLSTDLVLAVRGDIAYGNGYGDTQGLPFYARYYAGGVSTVRGYANGSLGPKYENGDTAGGNFRVSGSTELSLPVRLTDSDNARFGVFADFGNVYNDKVTLEKDDLRYSAGLFMLWRLPYVGAKVNLSYGWALNKKEGDELQPLQITFGVGL